MSNHTPPIVPNVLHVSDQRNPWQLAPIERLATRYHTPTTVATEFGTVDREVRPTPGKAGLTKHQHLVWCVPSDGAWQRLLDSRAALQQALDALAEELRRLGNYTSRLEKAGGFKAAPPRLCPTVIEAPDPDSSELSYWFSNPLPRIERKEISTHTPKMLNVVRDGKPWSTTHQRNHFVCPDDAAWQRVSELHQASEDAHTAWQKLLHELGTYDQALADGRYTKTSQAPLELAAPPTEPMITSTTPAETDLTPALFDRLSDARFRWHSATRTPDGRWHHLIEPAGASATIGKLRVRLERLEPLLANAERAPAAITVVEAVAVGVAMMGRDEAQALVSRIKRNLDGMRADLLELYEREGWKALGYPSWRECAVAEFGASAATLYRQLEAAEIERDVRGDSQVEKTQPIPTVQLQAVKDLSPAERRQAFERADELAGERPRTAADVRQAAAEIKPSADEQRLATIREHLARAASAGDNASSNFHQEAYGIARQMRDPSLRTLAFSLVDRAVEGKPAPAELPWPLPQDLVKRAIRVGLQVFNEGSRYRSMFTKGAANYAYHKSVDELEGYITSQEIRSTAIADSAPAPAAPATGWWNVGEHTRALQKAIDTSSRNDAIRAAQQLLATLLYSSAPARPRRPASADVSAQTRYMADLEQYALVLEVRLGAVQTFAQPAALPAPEPEPTPAPTGLQLGDIPADSPLAAIEAGVLQINAWLKVASQHASDEEIAAQKTALWALSDELDAPEGDIDDNEWAMLSKAIGELGEQLLALRQGQAVAA